MYLQKIKEYILLTSSVTYLLDIDFNKHDNSRYLCDLLIKIQ